MDVEEIRAAASRLTGRTVTGVVELVQSRGEDGFRMALLLHEAHARKRILLRPT
jgi:hypothetical protein